MKNFLVVGGSGYVGSAIIQSLHEEGHQVFASYHAKTVQAREHLVTMPLDLSNLESIEKFAGELKSKVQSLDGVVFAAGYSNHKILNPSSNGRLNFFRSFESSNKDVSEWLEQSFNVQCKGIYLLLKEIFPLLKQNKNCNVVIIGSLIGHKAVNTPIPFAATKASVRGLVESLSKDLGEFNIKVNSIDPGMLEKGASALISEQLKREYLKHCSLRRFGTAQEVSKTVTWFLDENTYITGQSILLDGGL